MASGNDDLDKNVGLIFFFFFFCIPFKEQFLICWDVLCGWFFLLVFGGFFLFFFNPVNIVWLLCKLDSLSERLFLHSVIYYICTGNDPFPWSWHMDTSLRNSG